jgi:nitrite reductase/ring-hydroxylating ferredoxin subunit
VLTKTELSAANGKKVVEVNGARILIAEFAGDVFAVSNKCSHLGLPLVGKTALLQGQVKDKCIICPAHGSAFDLATGEVQGEWCPSERSLPCSFFLSFLLFLFCSLSFVLSLPTYGSLLRTPCFCFQLSKSISFSSGTTIPLLQSCPTSPSSARARRKRRSQPTNPEWMPAATSRCWLECSFVFCQHAAS